MTWGCASYIAYTNPCDGCQHEPRCKAHCAAHLPVLCEESEQITTRIGNARSRNYLDVLRPGQDFTIHQLAELTGKPASTVRSWCAHNGRLEVISDMVGYAKVFRYVGQGAPGREDG